MAAVEQTTAQRAAADERLQILAAIHRVEAAVDAHATLNRAEGAHANDTRVVTSRDWVRVEMSVLRKTRTLPRKKRISKKPTVISAGADTLDEAVEKFINDLDIWAEVL